MAEHTILLFSRWNKNGRDISRTIKRAPQHKYAEDLLCGFQLQQLPNHEGAMKRSHHQDTIAQKSS